MFIFSINVMKKHTKSIAFLWTKNNHEKTKIKHNIKRVPKKMRYLGMRLIKQTQKSYAENYEMLLKNIKDDLNK